MIGFLEFRNKIKREDLFNNKNHPTGKKLLENLRNP